MREYYDVYYRMNSIRFKIFNFAVFQVVVIGSLILVISPDLFNIRFDIAGDLRLILVVCLGGMLGSSLRYSGVLVNASTSNNPVKRKEGTDFILKMLTGIPFNILCYFVLRGIILNSKLSYESFNVYGVLLLSFASGFFSAESLRKLTLTLQRLSEKDTVIDSKLERISSALGVDILDNYKGYFKYSIEKKRLDYDVDSTEMHLSPPSLHYRLVCRFLPSGFAPPNNNEKRAKLISEVEITGGNDVELVSFTITPKVKGIKITPSEKLVRVYQGQPSDEIIFDYTLEDRWMPDAWIEISQKGRLISVVTLEDENLERQQLT